MSWLTFSYISCQDVRNFCSADGSLHTSPRSNTAFQSKNTNAIVVGLVPRMSTWSLEVQSHEHIALLSGDATPKSESLHTSPRSNTAFRSKSMNAIVVGLVPRMSTWSLEVLSHEHIALLSGDATPKSYCGATKVRTS